MNHHRSKLPYFFLGLSACLTLSALLLLILKPGLPRRTTLRQPSPPVEVPPAPIENIDTPLAADDPDKKFSELGIQTAPTNAEDLVHRIARALEEGDLAAMFQLMGESAEDPITAARLRALSAAKPRLRPPHGIREVGELGDPNRTRWSLELEHDGGGTSELMLDLARDGRTWKVERILLPSESGKIPRAMLADPLGIADAFLQAVLKQDFEFARAFVDTTTVSDAKIAGLCILFEEGHYVMRKKMPLRTVFQRGDTAGFLANVVATDGSPAAQFSITLRRPPAPANWLVSEINLDDLLADYARRVAGGDLYYTPLVKNPAGGETLALYFEFDEDEMNPRTRRQLDIVALILKADPGKRLKVSGHTDAMGTDDYNRSLSERRAVVVRDFLVRAGVDPNQISQSAMGASQPRRPNVTETGDDNPEGRRANRRTEIYLDF